MTDERARQSTQIMTEVRMHKLETNVEDIQKTVNKLEGQVVDIQKKLYQVVWIAIGAGGMLIISNLGLTEFIQRVVFGRIM